MAFRGENMVDLGGNSRAGTNAQNRNAPMGWAYQSTTDDLAAIKTTGYFDTFNLQLEAGQFIYASLTDGKFIVTVASVDTTLKQVTIDGKVITPGAEPIIIGVTDTSSPVIVTLSTVDILAGLNFIIKDESGAANPTEKITVATEGSETIDGEATIDITVPFGSLQLYSNGTNLFSTVSPTTNATDRKSNPRASNVQEVYNQADLPAPVANVITLDDFITYRFKVPSLTLDAGVTIILGNDSFMEADLKDGRCTLVFISTTTAISTDGTNGVRARSMVFVQASTGELMNITSGADQTSRFIDCILSGNAGTKPIVRGVSGQLLQLEFTAFFNGARYVQDGTGGGIFGIKGMETSAFNDNGVSMPEGMMTFEDGSFTGGFSLVDAVFIMTGTGSVGTLHDAAPGQRATRQCGRHPARHLTGRKLDRVRGGES